MTLIRKIEFFAFQNGRQNAINHCTYPEGPTCLGTTACAKRSSERVKIEIKTTMDRLTNLFNSWTGSEVPPEMVQDEKFYVVNFSSTQSKQSATIGGLREEGPKVINRRRILEFGNSRNTKVWGSRRIHSTAFICGKGSSLTGSKKIKLSGFVENEQLRILMYTLKIAEKCKNLSKIMSDQNFLTACWVKIRSKKCSFTRAFNRKETLDESSEDWLKKTANSFLNGKFKFQPARRIYIPKANGKKRPLIIPSHRDKVVQEGMRFLLEIIFEPTFSENSHGWRPKTGCFSALYQIKQTFGGIRWFIEGDIEQQFPSLDHTILVNKLKEKIDDQPFIDLVYKYLNIGYAVNISEVTSMKRGVIQGGNLSPILANIYMDKFDRWMEEKLIPKFNKGTQRKANPEYTKMIRKGSATNKLRQVEIANDPNYKIAKYVRYSDNFLVGVIGSKEDCVTLREEMKNFLENELKLVLRIEKTKITHSLDECAEFLGHKIHQAKIEKMPIKRNLAGVITRRPVRPVLDAPIDKIVEKLKTEGFAKGNGKPCRNGKYIHLNLKDLVEHYKSIERGLTLFYGQAANYARLAARVHYILKYSCALTIASKMKLRTLRRVYRKYSKNISIKDENGKVISSYPTITYKKPKPHLTEGYKPENLVEKLSQRVGRARKDLEGPCKL